MPPLEHSSSQEAFNRNVAEMRRSGYPQDRALAAAYREKRQAAHRDGKKKKKGRRKKKAAM
jgi:hypothetical protein